MRRLLLTLSAVSCAAPAAGQWREWHVPQAAGEALARSDYREAERIVEAEIDRCEAESGSPLAISRRCSMLYRRMEYLSAARGDIAAADRWAARIEPMRQNALRVLAASRDPMVMSAAGIGRSIELEGELAEPNRPGGSRAAALAKYREAEAHYRRSLAAMKQMSDPLDFQLYLALAANLRERQQRPGEAAVEIRRGIAALERVFPKRTRDLAEAYAILANALGDQRKFAEAEPVHRRLVGYAQRGRASDHLAALTGLIDNLAAQKRWQAAAAVAAERTDVAREAFGAVSIGYVGALAELGRLHERAGDTAHAEAIFRTARGVAAAWEALPVTPDIDRYRVLDSQRSLYRGYVRVAWALGGRDGRDRRDRRDDRHAATLDPPLSRVARPRASFTGSGRPK